MKHYIAIILSAFLFSFTSNGQNTISKLNMNLIRGHGGFEIRPTANRLNFICNEASGICPSINFDGSYWVHEDSGAGPFVYLLSEEGRKNGLVKLNNVVFVDCEDIALDYSNTLRPKVVVADLGDNFRIRPFISFYRFTEPFANSILESDTLNVSAEVLMVTYPSSGTAPSGARDAESFFIDPSDGKHYVLSKETGIAHLYSFEWVNSAEPVKMKYELSLKLYNDKFTAADISLRGDEIILKTYKFIFHWHRLKGEAISETLIKIPSRLPYYGEKQGEAICFSRDADKFLTISEVRDDMDYARLMIYKRK